MQNQRHQPGQQNRVHIEVRQNYRQRIGQTAGLQDGVEGPACADNQQDIGDRAEAVFRMRQQGAHAHILTDAQHVIGHKDRDKHGGDGVTDKFQQHI